VSAVGQDDEGREVMARMEEWGLGTGGLQTDEAHPTGTVTATIVDGEPAYEIGVEQAYDFVAAAPAVAAAADLEVPLIYHGTLAIRTEASGETVEALQKATGARTYVDLNLRPPWWTPEVVNWILARTEWLKLAADELATVSGAPADSSEACEAGAQLLAQRYGLAGVIVTRGAWGSLMVQDGRAWSCKSEALDPGEVVDTVGAGDAFSAVACIGILEGWEPEAILARGNAFAAELCRIRGATTTDRSIYERHQNRWGTA
jgi:fructokinase